MNDSDNSRLNRRSFLTVSIAAICGLNLTDNIVAKAGAITLNAFESFKNQPMRSVAEMNKVLVAKDDTWYYGFTGVAESNGTLIASFLKTDQHLRTTTDIMITRSTDDGRTWSPAKSIAHLDIQHDEAIWVAPELNRLPDGRLILICDKGQRKPGQDLPVLSRWQTKERGMTNWIFLSEGAGLTWTKPCKTDELGGEPGRVHELSNGEWMYTRTDSRPTAEIKNPVEPWGANYYRSTAVFSDDKGKNWSRTSIIVDDPLIGDCEVDYCEYEPGKIVAFTRVGDAGSRYGQPSRAVYSKDYGRTWSKPVIAPFYGHRPIPGLLKSGKILVTFRNAWGTSGSYAFVFDPQENFSYQPNSFIWDESRCQLNGDAMEIKSIDGTRGAVEFTLYPVEDDDSTVEMTAEFAVKEADQEGCLVSAGAWVRFMPNRIELADRESEGFAFDTTHFHKYKFVNSNKKIQIYADGKLKLETTTAAIYTRYVHFGNRPGGKPPIGTVAAETDPKKTSQAVTDIAASKQTNRVVKLSGVDYRQNSSHTLWRSVSAKVMNRRDYSIDWRWSAKSRNFPDQFRRDRLVLLDRNGTFAGGNSGYSGWTQTTNGGICIVDYTAGAEGIFPTYVKAYLVRENDLP